MEGSAHQGSGSGDSNNLFTSERGLWTHIQGLEAQIRQLSERVLMMENLERAREEKIAQLTKETTILRNALKQQQDRTGPPFNGLGQQ